MSGLVTPLKDLETFQSKESITSYAQELDETSAHLFEHLFEHGLPEKVIEKSQFQMEIFQTPSKCLIFLLV